MPDPEVSDDHSVPSDAVVCTELLFARPSHPRDYEKENSALVALAGALADSGADVFQLLAAKLLELTQCDSSGMSLLTTEDGEKRLFWPAVAGAWHAEAGNEMSPEDTPCGESLHRNCTLLLHRFQRHYLSFQLFIPAPEECLIVPFHVRGMAVGTLWAVTHSDRRKFDAEDERIITALGNFASVAYQILETTRKQAAVREDAETGNLALTINTIPILVWSARPDGFADFFNQHFLNFLALSAEQAQGWGWTATIHPDDQEGLATYWQSIMQAGTAGEYEARYRRFDGVYRWFLIRAQPLRNESNNIVRWYGTNTDIEDRKNIEEALRAGERSLRESEESLRVMFNAIPALVCTLKPNWEVQEANPQLLEYFGQTLEDLKNWAFIGVVHPDDLDAVIARCQYSTETGAPYDIEHRCRRSDGVFRWFHVRGRPLLDIAGRIVRWYVVLVDIEDRKRAEQTLRESELRLRQLTETIPAMVWSAKPSGSIDYCNSRFLQYTALSSEEVTGDGWQKTLHPEDAARVYPIWMSCARTGAPYQVEVRTWHATDRTYRWCLVTALPLLEPTGPIVKWYGTIVDVHDWKRTQEELRSMQAELAHMTRVMTMGELTASIAHEVNQPLAAAVASSDSCAAWLANSPPNLEKARAAADRVVQAVTQASAVIQRIRTMFKKAPAVRTRMEINEVITEAVSLIQSEVASKNISLRTELADGMPLVSGDRVQITQVILNLAMNGIEAMSQPDHRTRNLVVRSETSDQEIRVTVVDSGPGLDPKIAARLFEPFFTMKTGGIGMGLSISKSIIEGHGGRLWAAANQSSGAIFHFALPTAATE